MYVLFGILTALTNAVAVTTQHIASTSSSHGDRGWRLVLFLLRNPLWLFGWIALVGSLLFQALALHFGPLSSVQPILLTELVFALLLRRVWLRQSVRSTTWSAAIVTCIGLSVFLVVLQPKGNPHPPTSTGWITTIVISCAAVIGLVLAGRTGTPKRRAAIFAIATSISWAVEACFIKAATDSFSPGGLMGALSRWPIYAFAIGGLVGLLLEQTTLHVGPLKVSLPLIVIVDPVLSVVLGVTLFAEHFSTQWLHLVLGISAFAVTCVAAFIMTQTSPETMISDKELR